MGSMSDYFLDEGKLEQGARVPVYRDGKQTDDWIAVLYMHSDVAQQRMVDAARADFASGEKVDPDTPNSVLGRRYTYCLVTGWSFDEECTPENVKELFKRNPRLANQVADKALQERLFFPDAGESSSTGSDTNSN